MEGILMFLALFGIVWHCLALWHQESSPESTKKASNSPDS